MLHLRFSLAMVVAAAAAGGLVGCVPYQTYDRVVKNLRLAKEANADLIKRYNEAIQRLAAGGTGVDDSELRARLAQLLADNEKLQSELANAPKLRFTDDEIGSIGQGVGEDGGFQLGETLLFAPGSDVLKPAALRVLREIVELLQSNYPDEMVIIEGHTDDQELRRTLPKYGTNMNLGYSRAHAVFDEFKKSGIPEKRLIIHSYSFNKPLDSATKSTTEGRRQNRRVVVRRGGLQI